MIVCRVYRNVKTLGSDKWDVPTVSEQTIFEAYSCFVNEKLHLTEGKKGSSSVGTATIKGKKTFQIKQGDFIEVRRTGKTFLVNNVKHTPNRSIFTCTEWVTSG